jgi:hypothetical protein
MATTGSLIPGFPVILAEDSPSQVAHARPSLSPRVLSPAIPSHHQ